MLRTALPGWCPSRATVWGLHCQPAPQPRCPLPTLQEAMAAPSKANWDLRRDVAAKLAKLERQTQAAMLKLLGQ